MRSRSRCPRRRAVSHWNGRSGHVGFARGIDDSSAGRIAIQDNNRDLRAIQISRTGLTRKDLSQRTPCRHLGPRWPIVTELVGVLPMVDFTAEDGCPAFATTVLLDEAKWKKPFGGP